MSRKGKDKPDYSDTPRFPVKRLAWNVVRGNMIFTGGVYCLAMGETAFEEIGDLLLGSSFNSGKLIRLNFEFLNGFTDGLVLNILLTSGSIIGLVWYIVARRIDTRHEKKRWLVYVKSREPETS